MDIGHQKADRIFNIAGDMHVYDSSETNELIHKQNQEKLKELYSISFLDVLHRYYSSQALIERNEEILNIEKMLELKNQIMVSGEPGIGKTTILYQLALKIKNVTYISLKNRAPVSTVSYLINRIRKSNHSDFINAKDINEAFDWLQVCLQNADGHFIIDHCECDVETVKKLITLEKFETKFLFGTRNALIFESTGIISYYCKPFNEAETKLFLESYGKFLNTIEFANLFALSKGNPLYLFFFLNHQIPQLPDSLVNYSRSIWNQLDSSNQEVLVYIALAYLPITISELIELFKYGSPMELSVKIDNLSAFIKNDEGLLEIFHPFFEDFIIEALKNKGVLNLYHKKLGDFYLAKNQIIPAIYSLIDIVPEQIDKYLYSALPILINWGELNFALKILTAKLKMVNSDIDKGYVLYHFYHVHALLGNKSESTICINQALEYLKHADDQQLYSAALLFKAMDLFDNGEINYALKIADEVYSQINGFENYSKASILLNLSKLYSELSEFKKGAKFSKEAFEIFLELEKDNVSMDGLLGSWANLVSCLTQTDEYIHVAEEYGLQLLEVVKRTSNINIEIVVLNALTSIYRQTRDLARAKEINKRVISLCQQNGMKSKLVINLVNYGNILRDEGLFQDAKKIYNEALVYAEEYNLKQAEGRIYWILAEIYKNEGNFDLSVEFADKSIALCKGTNYYYGIARAFEIKSETLILLKEPMLAAAALINSAEFYGKNEEFNFLYQQNIAEALKIYYSLGNLFEANKIFIKLIEYFIIKLGHNSELQIISGDTNDNSVEYVFEKLLMTYLSSEKKNINPFTHLLLFINYCRNIEQTTGNRLLNHVFHLLIQSLGKVKYSYSALGIALEQSGNLLNNNDLNNIFKSLQQKLPMFSVRDFEDFKIIIASIDSNINIEIHVRNDEITCIKLAMALVLVLHENSTLVIDGNNLKENYCILSLLLLTDELNNMLGNPRQEHITQDIQSVYMDKISYNVPDVVLINNDYELLCNLNDYPENRHSMYFFAMTIMKIKNHLYHINVIRNKLERTKILKSVAELFDFTNKELDTDSQQSEFDIEVDKINF